MIIPEEVICKTCEKVFCCPECREKHEVKAHGIIVQCFEPVVHVFCPICQNKPLILHKTMHNELFVHITENHLPLNCKKCSRLYTKLEDLMEFSKCIQSNAPCKLEIFQESELDVKPIPDTYQPILASSVSTQTSPVLLPEIHNVNLTPISMINLRWKAKSKVAEELIGDSVSSLKSISSINNSTAKRSVEIGIHSMKGKLVRSTSTPLQAEMFVNPKEQAFNITGGHVSSIYNSASEPENSPPLLLPVGSTPSNNIGEIVSRHQKPRRGKMSVVVTPLRQVMSKSIQKAIAEHRMAGKMRGMGLNRKKMFDSANSSCDLSEKSTESYPLDLRLSPALRRTQSEIIDRKNHLEFLRNLPNAQLPQVVHREILLSSTKKTTESIVITSSKAESVTDTVNGCSSVYKSCQSVEIVTSTSTELSELKTDQGDIVLEADGPDSFSGIPHITPRIPNAGVLPNKKLIKFETPVVMQKCSSQKHSPDEQFFTPSSTPLRGSKMYKKFQKENLHQMSLPRNYYSMEELEVERTDSSSSDYTDVNLDDEVFIEDKKSEKGRGNLWELVASMIGLPSLTMEKGNKNLKNRPPLNENSTSLMQRCASFAGSLVRQKSFGEANVQSLKRKRTNTASHLLHSFSTGDSADLDYTCSESKRLRIQGRKPIQRMQCNK